MKLTPAEEHRFALSDLAHLGYRDDALERAIELRDARRNFVQSMPPDALGDQPTLFNRTRTVHMTIARNDWLGRHLWWELLGKEGREFADYCADKANEMNRYIMEE